MGAEPARVVRMIFADGTRLALIGIAHGILGPYAAAWGMSALLFGVAPGILQRSPRPSFLALVMTFAGSLVPALRALRITPMSVLKAE